MPILIKSWRCSIIIRNESARRVWHPISNENGDKGNLDERRRPLFDLANQAVQRCSASRIKTNIVIDQSAIFVDELGREKTRLI